MPNDFLKPYLWSLESVFKNIYEIPVYQRPYSWTKEHVDVLLNDIIDSFRSDTAKEGYFTGHIILHDKNRKFNGLIPIYQIVDGQQRITSFTLILLCIYCISVVRGEDSNDDTVMKVRNSLWKIVNRINSRDYKVLTLNSIEKKCFEDLFNLCFERPKEVINSLKHYETKSKFERNVIDNFIYLYNRINNEIVDTDSEKHSILDFADYFLNHVQVISIETESKENKVFSMFESINSKGKRLEDIDLIKTYIFSILDEDSYEHYLNKWGQLIIKTDDNLYDYLYTFIKAYFYFYKNNISVVYFKKICESDLMSFYDKTELKEALKALIDDLYDKVDSYNMLFSVDEAYSLIHKTKFRFYYRVFIDNGYQHPKPLFFRVFVDFSRGTISKDDAMSIIIETIKFMLEFLSISNRDSKDAISLFKSIMEEVYLDDKIDKDKVLYMISSELLRLGVTTEKLSVDISTLDAYDQKRKLGIALLSLYESAEIKDEKVTISYDQAFLLIDSFKDSFSLDHLLPQKPKKDDTFFYYCEDIDGFERLKLKEGNDFPVSKVQSGIEYSLFTIAILNRLGNLRIYYKDKNSSRQNTSVVLKDYPEFNTYSDVTKREEDILKVLMGEVFKAPEYKIKKVRFVDKTKTKKFPKMADLIEANLVKIGDWLYVTTSPDDSRAELVSEREVIFNGEHMTLNEWGCKVTGWTSIRIYSYVSIVGETITLHDKRKQISE